jgi:hypothetical protein
MSPNQIGHASLGRFDDTQRGAHPDTSWGIIEEVPHAAEKPHLPQHGMRAAS